MIQLKIAFLDTEEAYLEQLKGYLMRRNETFFQIWTFSDTELFLKKAKVAAFDAVVMTAPFWEALKESVLEAKKILLCEGVREERLKECPYVLKHQSAEKLFCQISAMLWQEDREEKDFPEKTSELIGIYSPVHYENQMLFGMTMAQILGENQKVLYVNLMGHSGFYQLVRTDAQEDLGDLLYGMMQREGDFASGLHRIRQTYRNIDFIPPVVNPEHLSEISDSLLERFLMELKNRSGYAVVIIDFGAVCLGFTKIIPVFGSFYCLYKEGVVNRYRMEEFFAYLEKDGAHIAERIRRIKMPEHIAHPEDTNPLENGLYGGMGDYIRRSVYGGEQIG